MRRFACAIPVGLGLVLFFFSVGGCVMEPPDGDPPPAQPVDTDGDGVTDDLDECPDTPEGVAVDDVGCRLPDEPECGNGVVEEVEECDPPDGVACDENCQEIVPTGPECGDGTIDPGEECDPPDGVTCDQNCQTIVSDAECGNGMLESGEACDDGAGNSDTLPDACRTDCTLPGCGDGVVDSAEECDPPDGVNCDGDCRQILGPPPGCTTDAECDDRNACTTDACASGVCQHGAVVCPAGETCDRSVGCQPTGAVCGNDVVEAGEQCDPPDGVTCDDDCRIITAPVSDVCETPTPVGDGVRAFSNAEATTDGPDEPQMCDFFGSSQIASDVWFCYTASCTGQAVVSLCGSQYDTKMAVYFGCACPTAPPIACSDDDCGVGAVDSRVEFQAAAGSNYLIRVGGFAGAQGTGLLSVRCGEDVCSAGNGDCFSGNDTPGCEDADCCNTTCEVDPFCCDVEWDSFCAGEAVGLCTGSFPACRADAGDCFQANGTPGCDNVDCCNQVCAADPFCCVDAWDDLCAEETGLCGLTCGTGGSCSTVNSTPGCADAACCQTVCQEDPFCCSGQWDQECVDRAGELCP